MSKCNTSCGENQSELPPLYMIVKTVLAHPGIGPVAKLVMLSIIDHLGRNEWAYPGLGRLARNTCSGRRSVVRAIAQLERFGLLEVQHGQRSTKGQKSERNRYRPTSAFLTLVENADQGQNGATTRATKTLALGPKWHSNSPIGTSKEELTHSVESGTSFDSSAWKAKDIKRIVDAYPRKVGATKASAATRAALSEIAKRGIENPVKWLTERVSRFAKSAAGDKGRFTPYLATWMADQRYDDDPAEWDADDPNAWDGSIPGFEHLDKQHEAAMEGMRRAKAREEQDRTRRAST